MKKAGYVKKLICLIAMTCLMVSCGDETVAETAVVKTAKETLSMLEEADLSYEVPENLPGILVDIRGYGENEKKKPFSYPPICLQVFLLRVKKRASRYIRAT